MASSHGDHTVRIVDCKTGDCVDTLRGHPRTPWCLTFHPSSNQLLASGCLGGQVRVWNLKVNLHINRLGWIHPCHTVAILSRETKRALFYHGAKPRNGNHGDEA